MNIEDIVKAAGECRLATAQSMGAYGQYHYIDECPNHGLSCDELVEDSFVKGAGWRINSVWHDASEQPDRGKDIIVMYSNKSCRVFLPNGIWDNLIKVDKFIKWAYIDDLLPNTKKR